MTTPPEPRSAAEDDLLDDDVPGEDIFDDVDVPPDGLGHAALRDGPTWDAPSPHGHLLDDDGLDEQDSDDTESSDFDYDDDDDEPDDDSDAYDDDDSDVDDDSDLSHADDDVLGEDGSQKNMREDTPVHAGLDAMQRSRLNAPPPLPGLKNGPLDAGTEVLPAVVTCEAGRLSLSVRHVRELQVGQVLDLGRPMMEGVSLMLNGREIARGTLVDLDGRFGMMLTALVEEAEHG
jgi:flagellar motor switch/type III secretory pathway protein FliN